MLYEIKHIAGHSPAVNKAAQVIHDDGLGKLLQEVHACGIPLQVCSCRQVPVTAEAMSLQWECW